MTQPINYTARDFDTIREALKAHLQTKFPTTWKDFYSSGMGMALLELVAYSHDILSFYIDYTANEMFIDTARDRRSVWLLGRLVGYNLRTATSASVLCSATLPGTYPQALIIPAYTAIKTTDGVDFYAPEDIRIPADSTYEEAIALFVQGVRITDETFEGTGESWQKYTLANSGVVQGTLEVVIDGTQWTELASLVYADETTEGFSVEYDVDGNATISFGDNVSGKSPTLGSQIVVAYRTGGGVVGNISLNKIATNAVGYLEGTSPREYINVDLANDTERGSGGEDQETTEHAKLWIPYWVRANGRAVTEDDYDVLANAFYDPDHGSVAFAKARLKQNIPELNTVVLAVWGRDTDGNVTETSLGLKTALETYFNNDGPGAVKMVCQHCEVEDGEIVYIDVDVSIKTASDYVQSDVLVAVREKIEALFNSSAIFPGSDFRLSILYRDIQAVDGVDYSIVNSLKASLKKTEAIGTGDDLETHFTGTVVPGTGLSIIPGSVRIYHGSGDVVITDDGDGVLWEPVSGGPSIEAGTIDYSTGAVDVTFTTAPASGDDVNAEYRHLIDYQTGGLEATADGATRRYKGVLTSPPVNPLIGGLNGIAFSDGSQTILDDGNGNLVGSVDPAGVNTIDYQTGAYDFTFLYAPADETPIYSTYRQILNTASEDIPIDKNQVPVKGTVSVAAF